MGGHRGVRGALSTVFFLIFPTRLLQAAVVLAIGAGLVLGPPVSSADGPSSPRVFIPVTATEADASGSVSNELSTLPTLSVVTPMTGSTVRGTIQIHAKATGITSAVLTIDNGSPIAMSYDRASDRWVATVDTRAYRNGRYTLTVTGEGRRRSSAQAMVNDVVFDNASAVPTATPAASTGGTTGPTPTPAPAEAGVVVEVFGDALGAPWENWSWDGVARFDLSSPVYRGSRAIGFLNFAGFAGLDLHSAIPVDVSKATHLRFAARAGARDQHFRVALVDGAGKQLPKMVNLIDAGGDPIPDDWRLYQIPLSAFGAPVQQVTSVFIQDITGKSQPALHVDEIAFVSTTVAVVNPTPSPAATPVPWTPSPGGKLYGINLSGGEYTPSALPGVLGKDYVYPLSGITTSLYPAGYHGPAYFHSKGLRLLRIPVRWERLQPTPFGPLSTADVAALRRLLDDAASRQQQVILELHNFGSYYTTKLTPSHAPQFADAWQKIATAFAGHPGLYGYELMNEPGDLPGGSTTWKLLAQAGLDGVRRADRAAWVLIPGYHWQKANTWRTYNEDLLLRDPANKLLYAAHIYFDWDATGFHRYSYDAGGAYPTIGIDRLQPFLQWLTDHQVHGILTEYGVVDHDPRWLSVLDNFLRTVDSHPRLVGALAWAAGPLWGTPRDLGLDPLNGKDQPQMQVIAKFPSR